MHEIVGFVRSYLTQWSLSGQKKTTEILAREIVAILATALQVEEPTVASRNMSK